MTRVWRQAPPLFRSPRILLLVSPFILMAPVWLLGKALYWGTPSTQFIPWWWQAWQTLRAGEWPLWNPLVGMGAPLMANYQSALFYPPTWIYFGLAAVGGLPLMAWGQAILVALHLAWAAWGMGLLIRRLGLNELAQTVGGLAFALSGYLVARAHFLSVNAAVAWLPWILLAAFDLVHQPHNKRHLLKLALLLAMQWLAGHAQVAWYTFLLALAWTAFWAWRAGRGQRLWQTALGFAAAAFGALLLSLVQLLPTAEFLLNSQRAAQVDFAEAATYSFWPWRLLALFAPNFFGNPAHGNYWGYGNYWEDAIYVGLLPLSLAIAAVWAWKKFSKDKPLVFFLIGLSCISILLALGNNTPLFAWLFAHVPSFSLFQSPTRFSLWLVFALALLAAFAAARWKRPTGRALYWSRLAVAAAVAVIFGSVIALWLQAQGLIAADPTFFAACFSMGFFALGATLLNLHAPKSEKFKSARWVWLVSLLLAADLLYAGWGLNPGADLNLYKEDAALHTALRQELGEGRLYLSPADERALKFEQVFRFDTFFSEDPRTIRAVLLPNIAGLDGFPSANNFDPLVPARYTSWMDVLDSATPEQQAVMLARMNVSVVETRIPDEGASVSFTPLEYLPRARWVNCVQVGSAHSSPLDSVEIDIAQPSTRCGTGESGQVVLGSATANRIVLDVDAAGGGWLILADTYYPGWHAFANGKESIIYPADGVFRAVYLEPGQVQLEFVYQPLSFYCGLTVSVGAWLSWFFFWRRWKFSTLVQ